MMAAIDDIEDYKRKYRRLNGIDPSAKAVANHFNFKLAKPETIAKAMRAARSYTPSGYPYTKSDTEHHWRTINTLRQLIEQSAT